MGFWSKLLEKKGKKKKEEEEENGVPASDPANAHDDARSTPPSEPPEMDDVAILVRALDAGDAAGALQSFATLRTSPEEGRAIDTLLARSTSRLLPEPLAIAVARALIERGEPPGAEKLLAPFSSPDALLVAADLAAERGDLPGAVARVERVLLARLDHPGARERHTRWRRALGLETDAKRPAPAFSTMLASEPDAPYVLLREVARGGAGAVYEAEDRDLGRRLALKIYHEPEAGRAQLTHEARVAAALSGPGIVRVLDADPEHGWLALEWAARGALRDAIRTKDLSLLVPIERWAVPLAEALVRVHAAGWVHLDVKPANVLFAAHDHPLLADFGSARRAGEATVPGSFGYVSPERLAGRSVDPRDDVYGFGRILEDVLRAVADPKISARFGAIAAASVAPDTARLPNAREILARLRP